MITMMSGWAVKCITGTPEKNLEVTFIMVTATLPTVAEIAEATLAMGSPLIETISVQRSVPLALDAEDGQP